MNRDKYEAWEPLPGISKELDCESVLDDKVGLCISLRTREQVVRVLCIHFDVVICYRNINESYRLRTWSRFEGADMGGLFSVENSGWISWVRTESCGVLDRTELVHYAVFTDEDCIEVIAEFPPRVEWRVQQG